MATVIEQETALYAASDLGIENICGYITHVSTFPAD